MVKSTALFVILSLSCVVSSPVAVNSRDDNNKGVSFRGHASDLYLQPESATINLQVLPGLHTGQSDDPTKGGTTLQPIHDNLVKQIGDIVIHGRDLGNTVACASHNTQTRCLLDVECGWCQGNNGTYCVEGSFTGPCNTSIECPLYTTYQQPGMGSHDCGTDTKPCDERNDDDVFKPMMTESLEGFDGIGDNTVAPGAATTESMLSKLLGGGGTSQSSPGGASATASSSSANNHHAASSRAALAASLVQRAKSNPTMKQVKERMREVEREKIEDVDELPSPCGLPGTTDAMCRQWVLMHCGGDSPANDPSCDLDLKLG